MSEDTAAVQIVRSESGGAHTVNVNAAGSRTPCTGRVQKFRKVRCRGRLIVNRTFADHAPRDRRSNIVLNLHRRLRPMVLYGLHNRTERVRTSLGIERGRDESTRRSRYLPSSLPMV